MFVFVTEVESGGRLFPTLINRLLVSMVFSNLLLALSTFYCPEQNLDVTEVHLTTSHSTCTRLAVPPGAGAPSALDLAVQNLLIVTIW